MQNEKKWFAVSEAAKYLGVSPDTLRRWEKAGKIPAPTRTAGGARRYSKDLLEEILSGGKKEEKGSGVKEKTQRPLGKKPLLVSLVTAIIVLIITLAIFLPIFFILLK